MSLNQVLLLWFFGGLLSPGAFLQMVKPGSYQKTSELQDVMGAVGEPDQLCVGFQNHTVCTHGSETQLGKQVCHQCSGALPWAMQPAVSV